MCESILWYKLYKYWKCNNAYTIKSAGMVLSWEDALEKLALRSSTPSSLIGKMLELTADWKLFVAEDTGENMFMVELQ